MTPLTKLLTAIAFGSVATNATAEIQFTDVTTSSGISYFGESYGSSWGDYNGDGWPDAFVSNHRNAASLYVNLGNGKFENRWGEVEAWQLLPNADQHGGSWADFDKDGDQDLFVAAGVKNFSQFLVNDGQFLVDRTSQYPFNVKLGARAPTWFDFTHDGKLDFAMNIQEQRTNLWQQTATSFANANTAFGNPCTNTDFTHLADVTRDGKLDWICVTQGGFPSFVSNITTKPFTNVTSSVFPTPVPNAVESILADFDGDLVSDAFVLKGKERVSGAEIVAPNRIEAHMINFTGDEVGFSFRSTGDVTFRFHWNARSVNNIWIGAGGSHPPFLGANAPLEFTLSPSNPAVHGVAPRNSNPGKETIYIGYDPSTQTWEMWNVANSWSYVYAFLSSTQNVSDLTQMSLQGLDGPLKPAFLASASGAYLDRTNNIGFTNVTLPCKSLAAADFDNDMDLDLFFVCRNAVSNAPDRLYENQNGTFVPVANAGGAAGPIGPGTGLGEAVSVVDYDVDGFVDMLVHNGLALFPAWDEPNNGGPDKLYSNAGEIDGTNNWVEIDLVGVTSNRDAIGARVIANAGGFRQLREQGGNYKRWTQSHQRLHFGLGTNSTVSLEVTWPSGTVQTFNNVAANQLYRITENNSTPQPVVLPPVSPSPCGPAGGLPAYNPPNANGVFMGKNCATGQWKLRVASGTSKSFRGSLKSSQPFTNVTGVSVEANDIVDTSNPLVITYKLGVGGAGDDGFNFSFPEAANVCFDSTQPAGVVVRVGGVGTVVQEPFDLRTLGPCAAEPPPDCGMPTYNTATERAIFIGKVCSTGVWQFRATAGGQSVSYQGAIQSDQPFSNVTGFSIEASDVLDWTSGESDIGYTLNMAGSGQDGFNLSYPAGAHVCVGVAAPPGVQVFRGPNRQLVTVPFDLDTGGPCQ